MAGLSDRSSFTVAAMLGWLLNAALAAVIAAALVFGPELADLAWDAGVHVTPGQAMLHYALIAEGIQHHHHALSHSTHAVAADEGTGASLDTAGQGLTFGAPLNSVSVTPHTPCLALVGCNMLSSPATSPTSYFAPPDTPPPRSV
jgi:hypothetical protein